MTKCAEVFVFCLKFIIVLSTLQDDRRIMQGFNMRLPATINKPFIYSEKDSNGSVVFKGFGILLADYMVAGLNITYSLVPVNASLIAQRGFNQALLDMLFKGDVDIVMAPVMLSLQRKAYTDFTYPLSFDAYKIAYPWPKQASRLLAPLWPYQNLVWILFICSLLATTVMLALISWFWIARRTSENSSGNHIGRIATYVVAITLGQGDFLPYRDHSIRIAATGWCLMSVVIVNSYSGILTSFLTLPVYEKPINTLEDLAERTDIALTIPADSALLPTFLEAQSGVYKAIGDGIRRRPEGLYKTIDQGLKLVSSGKYAYLSVAFYVEYLLADDYKNHKTCLLTASKALDFSLPVSFGLPINGPYNQIINLQFVRMWEYGLVNHWLDIYRGRFEQCILKTTKPRMAALKLKDLYSAFIILFLGVGISLLVLLYEKIRYCYQN